MTLIVDIKTALEADTDINDILDSQIYERDPVSEPSGTYLTLTETDQSLNTKYGEDSIVEFIIFGTDFATMANLSELIKNYFRDNQILNGTTYYNIYFINKTDSKTKLQNGNYFSILNFGFKSIIANT